MSLGCKTAAPSMSLVSSAIFGTIRAVCCHSSRLLAGARRRHHAGHQCLEHGVPAAYSFREAGQFYDSIQALFDAVCAYQHVTFAQRASDFWLDAHELVTNYDPYTNRRQPLRVHNTRS
jgi:hypothetical protein